MISSAAQFPYHLLVTFYNQTYFIEIILNTNQLFCPIQKALRRVYRKKHIKKYNIFQINDILVREKQLFLFPKSCSLLYFFYRLESDIKIVSRINEVIFAIDGSRTRVYLYPPIPSGLSCIDKLNGKAIYNQFGSFLIQIRGIRGNFSSNVN